MPSPLQIVGQALAYLVFALVIGIFSTWPGYTHLQENLSVVKLSVSHIGERKGECRERETSKVAITKTSRRALMICPRERYPVRLELTLDGDVIFDREMQPTGLSSDGPSYFYKKLIIPTGPHSLRVRMRDSGKADGFDYETTEDVSLSPGQVLAIRFNDAEKTLILD
ncbi:MAG: hypothetical protein HOO00_06580 [Rhodospirillaceae bacterium]|jgi:hypothetical protein|nr:hypothetical protein [Rhodospirillaceae bacterium]MBT5374483.1 hypothetical protein [Rhodospirillaceae bacterium]MBT5752514.1 hypothetical protein [Rhodospirillaceae bacterium]